MSSDLVVLPGFSTPDEDAPRFLNPDEIEYVVRRIPYVEAADRTASEYAREGLIEYVRAELEEHKICPSAVAEMIEEMVKQFKEALVHPGMSAGINGAEAVGAVTTQMTLNSFHSSGSAATMSKGIDLMQDLMYARKNPKNPTTYVYFKTKDPLGVMMSYREALETRQYLVATTMNKFVYRHEVFDRTEFENTQGFKWWHSQNELPIGTKMLRLYLNVDELYKYRVSPAQFASVFDRENVQMMVAQASPISEGIVDLFPNAQHVVSLMLKEKLKNINAHQTAEISSLIEGMYLENIVVKTLDEVRIGGIPELKDINPLGIPVIGSSVTQQSFVGIHSNGKSIHKLYLNPAAMRIHNITLLRIKTLLLEVGVETLSEEKDTRGRVTILRVLTPENFTGKVSDLIDGRVRDLKKTNPDDRLVVLSEIMHLEASSTNLEAIRNHWLVDPDRTYCNNQYVMTEVLGCEPTYMSTASDLVAATGNQGVGPAHAYLEAEFIMSRGYPYGTTYTGITKQSPGHLTLATVERAGDVFASHALYRKSEATHNVSAAIMVGTRVTLGTGFCDVAGVIHDSREGGAKKLFMNEDLYTAWKYDERSQRDSSVTSGQFVGSDDLEDDEVTFDREAHEDGELAGLGQEPVTAHTFSGDMIQPDLRDAPVKTINAAYGRTLNPDPRELWEATSTFNSVPLSPLTGVPSSSSGPIESDIYSLL